ncbi:MAG TPA: hypothetical protein VK154_08275 [Chitinophagales bacterium]|nr:hypothetical protein [Chitinophagales bacterium]
MNAKQKVYLFLLLAAPFFAIAQQQDQLKQQQKQPKLSSYDSDGDGIPDSTDQCVLLKGSKDFKGCPYQKKVTTIDRDGDGLKDALDKCPDMFGLETNHGCPETETLKNTKERSTIIDEGSSLFTTTSSLSTEEDEIFKTTLSNIMTGSIAALAVEKDELSIASNTEGGIPAASCLPGAKKCYLSNNSKTFYADFGIYTSQETAAAKYYALRKRLNETLRPDEWNGKETETGGYIDKFELTPKIKTTSSPIVTTHVDRMNDTYRVYITVERE